MQPRYPAARHATYVHHITQDPCRGGVGAGHSAHLRVPAVAHGGCHASHCFHWSLIRTCRYAILFSLLFSLLFFLSFLDLSYHSLPCFRFPPLLLSSVTYRLLMLSMFSFYPYPAGHSLSLFNLSTVRAELAVVYTAMSMHPSSSVAPSLRLNALTIAALIAVDRKLIDSRDFAECMPVFQALGGEVKDRIALLSATATAAQANTGAETGANTDAMPASKAGKLKRSRIEITEPNLNKSRKTTTTLSAGAGSTEGEAGAVMDEIVLDPETLTWSALLGPQGARYLLYFISPPLNSSSSVLIPSLLFFLTYCNHLFFFLLLIPLIFTTLLTLSTSHTLLLCLCNLLHLITSSPFLFYLPHCYRLLFASSSHTVHGGSA